jgi:hypothetical protein
VPDPTYVKPRIPLARVLDALGDTFLEVVLGPARSVDVAAVEIYDQVEPSPLPQGAIVFGIGLQDADEVNELLHILGQSGAAALVVRAPASTNAATARAVDKSGVTLLSLTRGASWARLGAMLRTLLAEVDVGHEPNSTIAGLPTGDLFALANAIAALIDAPVTIEDKALNVLAFSGRQNEADTSRIATILGRKVPQYAAEALERTGVLAELYTSSREVVVRPEQTNIDSITMPRVAVAVRAGEDVLGSIWGVVDAPLSQARATALRDAAKVVSLHLLRMRAGADMQRRVKADLIAKALDGGPNGAEALSKMGLLGRPVVVVALDLVRDDAEHVAESASLNSRQRVSDALALHMSAVAPGSAVTLLGDVTYCLFPIVGAVDSAPERVVRVVSDFLARTGSKVPAVIGVGPVASDPSQLSQSRLGADRALRVLLNRGRSGQVATTSDVLVDVLLLELGDVMAARGDVVVGPVARLAAHDAEHGGQLLRTLQCWLECFGDVGQAAAAAHVHPNTFRYRLKRLSAIGGIDLADPDERFAAMLQFRLMTGSADEQVSSPTITPDVEAI